MYITIMPLSPLFVFYFIVRISTWHVFMKGTTAWSLEAAMHLPLSTMLLPLPVRTG